MKVKVIFTGKGIESEKKIPKIKAVRSWSGLALKEAKDIVESGEHVFDLNTKQFEDLKKMQDGVIEGRLYDYEVVVKTPAGDFTHRLLEMVYEMDTKTLADDDRELTVTFKTVGATSESALNTMQTVLSSIVDKPTA